MKKRMMMVLGAAGIVFSQAPADVQAALPLAMATRHDPDVSFDARPDFIYLDDYGFYVAWGVPYDLIFFDDYYFLFRDGYWYRSRGYRGPWGRVRNDDLPMTIRRRNWGDIRQRRDTEYRRHDRGFWDNRFRMDRERWRSRDNRNAPEGRPAPGRDRGFEDRREQPGGERDFERRDRR